MRKMNGNNSIKRKRNTKGTNVHNSSIFPQTFTFASWWNYLCMVVFFFSFINSIFIIVVSFLGSLHQLLFSVENKQIYCVSCTHEDSSKKQRSLYKVSHQKQSNKRKHPNSAIRCECDEIEKNIIMLFQNGSEQMEFLAVAPSRMIERKTISKTVCSKTI